LENTKIIFIFAPSNFKVKQSKKKEEMKITANHNRMAVALRTRGLGIVIEGGREGQRIEFLKEAFERAGIKNPTILDAEDAEDVAIISLLPSCKDAGVIVINNLLKLGEYTQFRIANHMKVLADEEASNDKIIIVGESGIGDVLVRYASDLNNRMETIKFENIELDGVITCDYCGEYEWVVEPDDDEHVNRYYCEKCDKYFFI